MILQMLFRSQCDRLAFPNGTRNVSGWMGAFSNVFIITASFPLSYLFEACVGRHPHPPFTSRVSFGSFPLLTDSCHSLTNESR